MNLDYYAIFYYVCKYQSFSKAAKALYMAQPNISRTINKLEEELEVQLFLRSKKGITLTKEGEALYQYVAKAMELFTLGKQKIEEFKKMESGSISIGVSEIALHEYVLPLLNQYKILYPQIQIQIKTHTSKQAIDALINGVCDLAIISSPIEIPDQFQEVILQEFQDILITSGDDYHFDQRKVQLEDLQDEPIIMLKEGTTAYTFYEALFHHFNLPFHIDVEAVTTDQILPLVRHHLGLGFIPERLVKEDLEKGNIKKVNLITPIPARKISLVYDQNAVHSIAIEKFLKLLAQK